MSSCCQKVKFQCPKVVTCCPTFSPFSNGCRASLRTIKEITSSIIPLLPIIFQITITNTSKCPALNVILVDPLPPGILVPGSIVISPSGTLNNDVVVVNIGTIAAGATVVVTITATLSDLVLGPVTNTAFVAGSNVCSVLTPSATFSILPI